MTAGRGQYHQIIVWIGTDDGRLIPARKSRYWDHYCGWVTYTAPITVESLYDDHTQWIADQIYGTKEHRAAA